MLTRILEFRLNTIENKETNDNNFLQCRPEFWQAMMAVFNGMATTD